MEAVFEKSERICVLEKGVHAVPRVKETVSDGLYSLLLQLFHSKGENLYQKISKAGIDFNMHAVGLAAYLVC